MKKDTLAEQQFKNSFGPLPKNKNINFVVPIRNYKGEFIETYNKEVTPERKEKLHADLAKFESNKDKIAFLRKEYLNYLQNISPTVLESSGTVHLPNFKAGEPLFFDRYIQLEIQKLSGGRFDLELGKNQKPKAQILQDIFIETKHFESAVEALKIIKVIDRNNANLIGSKLKGVMQVWVKILRTDRQYLIHINDRHLTVLLNTFFTGLDLSESTDGKHFRNSTNKTASNQYRTSLLAAIR